MLVMVSKLLFLKINSRPKNLIEAKIEVESLIYLTLKVQATYTMETAQFYISNKQ